MASLPANSVLAWRRLHGQSSSTRFEGRDGVSSSTYVCPWARLRHGNRSSLAGRYAGRPRGRRRRRGLSAWRDRREASRQQRAASGRMGAAASWRLPVVHGSRDAARAGAGQGAARAGLRDWRELYGLYDAADEKGRDAPVHAITVRQEAERLVQALETSRLPAAGRQDERTGPQARGGMAGSLRRSCVQRMVLPEGAAGP